MSVKHCLLLGTALLLSACASQSAIDETNDIASQFCLTNSNPQSDARQLLLSPSLARLLEETQIRTSGFPFENETRVTTTTTTTIADASLQPPVQTTTTTNAEPAPAVETAPGPICKPGRMFTVNGVRYAEIRHGMSDGSADWIDRLVLKNINGRWMIDDILFAPDYRRGMRETLIRTE